MSPEPITASALTASSVAGIIAKKGFEILFGDIVKKALRTEDKIKTQDFPFNKFKDHLQQTFDRCTKIKTLLSRDEAVDMLQQYVHIKFRSKKGAKDITIDDYDIIKEIRTRRRAAFVGTAGGGKTVFMRYLWTCFFVDSDGRIPIFLELRRLSDLTSIDLLTFIFRNILLADETAGMGSFNKALRDGKFIFILDGFDEVAADKRINVEKQILDLCNKYPLNFVVISSRPDERLEAWQEFRIFRVEPLSLRQVSDLVDRVDFDVTIKKKFKEALNKDLYNKHRSFLSSPLLATMMLLTFQHYAEIPEKIHVFYDLAYQTLFSKHDALKEAFKREKYTKFPIDEFKRRLACLCMVTYIDERFEFNESELLVYIAKSARLDGVQFAANDFMRDLLESVCILQQDGLQITFSHRSFQEFFTANYLASMPRDKLRALLPRLASRDTDSVFTMLADMSRELIEAAYVVPMIRKARPVTESIGDSPTPSQIVFAYGHHLRVHMPGIVGVAPVQQSDVRNFRGLAMRIYPSLFADLHKMIPTLHDMDLKVMSKRPTELERFNNKSLWITSPTSATAGEMTVTTKEIEAVLDWFDRSGHGKWFSEYEKVFRRLMSEVPRNNRRRSDELRKILDI